MLPGYRLIAASFLCGFVVVFAGLRLVASLHNIHEGLPIMAAQAASAAPAGMIEPLGTRPAKPVLYDLRFVASTTAPQLINLAPQPVEQMPPKPMPIIEEASKELPAADSEPTPAPTAAIDPQHTASLEPAPAEPPAAAAPATIKQALDKTDTPLAELSPVSEPSAPVESKVAVLAPDPEPTSPTAEPAQPPKLKAAKRATRHVRKKRVQVARRAAPKGQFGEPSGNSAANSFNTR